MRGSFLPYLIITAFVLLIDFYSFQAVKAVTRDLQQGSRRFWEILFWGITAFTLFMVYLTIFTNPFRWPVAVRSYLFATIFLIYISKIFLVVFVLFDDILRLFRWIGSSLSSGAGEGPKNVSRLKFINQLGMVVAGFVLSTGLYGMIANAYNYRIHRVRVGLKNLPDSFNGLKIVQLSDIHSGSFTRSQPLIDAVATINAENPDIIFFTGDLVNDRASEVEPYLGIFSKLKAKEGIYSTFGNHDYGDYDPEFRTDKVAKENNHKALMQHHKDLGWDLLMDEHRMLKRGEDQIAIIGVQNCSAQGFHTYGDLAKAYKGSEKAPVKLLLSHDPSYWDHVINQQFKDIDITFAGHTHGAQLGIEIPGFRWSPSQYMYKQWAGLYQTAEQYIYVNRGFGFLGYPGRIGILPEITVMELYKA